MQTFDGIYDIDNFAKRLQLSQVKDVVGVRQFKRFGPRGQPIFKTAAAKAQIWKSRWQSNFYRRIDNCRWRGSIQNRLSRGKQVTQKEPAGHARSNQEGQSRCPIALQNDASYVPDHGYDWIHGRIMWSRTSSGFSRLQGKRHARIALVARGRAVSRVIQHHGQHHDERQDFVTVMRLVTF